jgi:heme A synthase
MTSSGSLPNQSAVATWLAVCAAMVLGMVVLGGATRLTHSGLSIVEWQPIVGTLPPLSDAEWNTTFDKYKQTPEYKRLRSDFSFALRTASKLSESLLSRLSIADTLSSR